MSGWIKLHRSFSKWEWYDQPNCVTIFIDLLLQANHEDGKYRGVKIPKGSLTTSQAKIAERTGLTISQVRTVLDKLSLTGEIAVESTTKFSMISVINWAKYQSDERLALATSQSNRNQIATNNNEIIKETNNIIIKASPLSFLFDSKPFIQEWLNAGNHDTHLVLVKKHSHHELAELIEKAYDWAQAKNQRAETWLITFMNNKNTKAYVANQAQKSFSKKTNGITPTPENPTGSPYLQEAIDKGLTA